jgi:hypothetical protein
MGVIVVSFIGLIAVPILLVLAYRGWVKMVRAELSQWRNGLAFPAFLITFANWVAVAALELPSLINPSMPRSTVLNGDMLILSRSLSLLAVVLSLALRRGPRIQALLAGLLMLLSWPIGYV